MTGRMRSTGQSTMVNFGKDFGIIFAGDKRVQQARYCCLNQLS